VLLDLHYWDESWSEENMPIRRLLEIGAISDRSLAGDRDEYLEFAESVRYAFRIGLLDEYRKA
jgi:hypothetical protein